MSELHGAPRLRLLAGTDFSERSRNAFSRAVQLANDCGGAIALVHVGSDLAPPNLMAAQDSFANDMLDDHVRKAHADGVRHVTREIAHGREYEELIQLAAKEPCDLIVLGRHRPSSLLQDMLGTTSSHVLRLAGIPVLVVQHKAEQAYKSVLVAVDFSPASRRALEYAMRWFPKCHIEIVTAYVSPRRTGLFGRDSIRESVAETRRLALKGFVIEVAQGLGPDYATLANRIILKVEHGWPEDVIEREINAIKPDLLVIGTHARSGVGHALLGSVAEWVLLQAPCDILVVPPPQLPAGSVARMRTARVPAQRVELELVAAFHPANRTEGARGPMSKIIRTISALAVAMPLLWPMVTRAEEPEPELGVQPNVKESKVPDVANGEALSRKLCVGCHVIERGSAAISQADVPSFPTIADRPNQTVEALTTWLLQPHAPMPDPHLSRVEIRDLAGYIISLRKSP